MMLSIVLTSFSFLLQQPREAVCTWYGQGFHGRLTACGEIYDVNRMTVADLNYPMGTIFLMWKDGRSIIVIKNDTGPFVDGVDFDLSTAAFKHLAPCRQGRISVHYIVLGRITRPSMLYNLGESHVEEDQEEARGDPIEKA